MHTYVNANSYLGVTAPAFNPSSQEAEAGPYERPSLFDIINSS